MFVKKQTDLPVALPRTHFAGTFFVASLVTVVPFRWSGQSLARWEGTREKLPSDPPASTDRTLWQGASMTVAGSVVGPGRVPKSVKVELRLGQTTRSLVVHGDRTWVKNAGKLVPSQPAAWDRLPLTWDRAFGGSVTMPAGPVGPNKLPHPGAEATYAFNPGGRGFCLDEAKADGVPLPNIESPEQPVKTPLDRPFPAGFAPCPELPALRAPTDVRAEMALDPEYSLGVALRMAHAAPGSLIFPRLDPHTPVEVAGMGSGALRFELPVCPIRVSVRKGKTSTELPPAIRSVHVSTDDGAVLVTYAASFSYEQAPSWIDVSNAS